MLEIDKEQLYQKYVTENLTRKACASFFNVNEALLKRKIKDFGIKKGPNHDSGPKKVYIEEKVLRELYINENLSMSECAKRLGVSFNIVKRRLKDFDIKKPQDKFVEIHKTHVGCYDLKKRKETLLVKYGVDNVSKLESVKKKKEKTTYKHYGASNPYSCMREECRSYSGNNSQPNLEFAKLLEKHEIAYEREFNLGEFSYDFKVDDYLIEIDPTPFHNSDFAPVGKPKSTSYHLEKSTLAKENGYKCIHIFDWDNKEKVIETFFGKKERIFARKCEIREVSRQETILFLEKYHLQGYARDKIRLGLYEKVSNELVMVMTFNKPRYNLAYEYEIIRLCAEKVVVGGAEKLFKAFLDKYEPKGVISYCDAAKFDGKIYEKLGFKLKNSPQPSAHWINVNKNIHITDNLLRQRGFDQLFKTNFGKFVSNEELMLKNDFVRVYDCGQMTYTH